MAIAAAATGSGARQGELWGRRPLDWGAIEEQQLPTYEEGIRRHRGRARRPRVGRRLRQWRVPARRRRPGRAAARPRRILALLRLARARVPEAELRRGDAEWLPFDDDSFDLVTGFNSFFFAADMTAALREAARVARPGAPVLIQVWGRPERCELTPMLAAVGALRPGEPEPRPDQPSLWEPGVLEQIATAAGLEPESCFDVRSSFEFPDRETLIRQMLAPGPVGEAVRHVGEPAVGDAIAAALAPRRRPDGSYRLENEWHCVLARA